MMYKRRLLQQNRADKQRQANHLLNMMIAYSTLNTWFPHAGYQYSLSDAVGQVGRFAKANKKLFNYKLRPMLKDLLLGGLTVVVIVGVIMVSLAFMQALLPSELWAIATVGIIILGFYVGHRIEKRTD